MQEGSVVGWIHMFEMRYIQGVRSCSQGSPSGIWYFGHSDPKLENYCIQYLINVQLMRLKTRGLN